MVAYTVLSPLTFFKLINLFYFTKLYWYCHTLTQICHGCTCVPHPETPSHLSPHPIPLGHPTAPAPSTLYQAPCIIEPAKHIPTSGPLPLHGYLLECSSPESKPHRTGSSASFRSLLKYRFPRYVSLKPSPPQSIPMPVTCLHSTKHNLASYHP